MLACQQFLTARLLELHLANGSSPYRVDAPAVPDDPHVPGNQAVPAVQGNIFFDELPIDYLKDNDFAACCLPLQDRKKKYGKLIAKVRTLAVEATEDDPAVPAKYTFTRRRYEREVTFRCMLWAPAASLWTNGAFVGLVEQFEQGVAQYKVVADADNSVVRIDPQEATRPWDTNVELEKKLRRPPIAIVRVQFTGGLQKKIEVGIIPDVSITPTVGDETIPGEIEVP
jgi:hypothetical protein